MHKTSYSRSYWEIIWQQFRHHKLAYAALIVVMLFCVIGIYAPFLASSKPIVVYFDGEWYFPLFRYLFYRGFFTKRLDLFYNLLMFTLPIFVLTWMIYRHSSHLFWAMMVILAGHFALFAYLAYRTPQDPAASPLLNQKRQARIQQQIEKNKSNPLLHVPLRISWDEELSYMNAYAKLNLVLRYQQQKRQHEKLLSYAETYAESAKKRGLVDSHIPTLWYLNQKNEEKKIKALEEKIEKSPVNSPNHEKAKAELVYLKQRQQWLETQSAQLKYEVMPFIRPYHWEDDAGGNQNLNQHVSWWNLTRINRKDMVASLIFGIRISLSVGLLAVSLALLIGIPIGALAGFYGGKIDMVTYRLIEIWESMPTFFMLLMIVAFLQSKSIFLVIGVIGAFGWTGFSRFIRGEFFKQKQLPYAEACRALGFNDRYIMFTHLLPNAIPPLLTLVPFAIMGAITSEAGLSFLGLGEEGSCSWGVLMDEGRTAFPSESYLLWPPAILLILLLVAIALVGDALRDALDPKMHH